MKFFTSDYDKYKVFIFWKHQMLVSLDQLINTMFIGWADETISSRVYRLSQYEKFYIPIKKFINSLFFLENDHCFNSYDGERKRIQFPPELRTINDK